MSTDKPSRNEDEYFARQEMELLEQQRAAARAALEESERRSHYMKCPKDGHDLVAREFEDVQVDVCTHCGGIWLDPGELDQLTKREDPGVLRRVFGNVASALRRSES